jgi:hypothetical protein
VRVTQTLLRRLRTVETLERVTVVVASRKELLQLLRLVGVGTWQHQEESPGRWSVWRIE